MSDVVDLKLRRLEAVDDNKDISVEDLLELVLHHVRSHQDPPAKRCILLLVRESENGDGEVERYRCGVSRSEEAGYLAIGVSNQLDDWRK